MAGLKELKRRLVSVKNTKKSTYAMKLVSAAKLRKAQESVTRSREYTEALYGLLADLGPDILQKYAHPLMVQRSEVRSVVVVVMGGNRGLCGAYNSNINRRADTVIKDTSQSGLGITLGSILMGRKPVEYFKRVNRTFIEGFEELSDDALQWPIVELSQKLEEEYREGRIDEAYVLYTKFRSAMSTSVVYEKVLPIELTAVASTNIEAQGSSDALFEPSPYDVFSALVPRLLRAKLQQAALDAKASEHGSRMTAMDAATKNAGDLIQRLQLTYNKLRQSGITSELLDIIGGAEATQ